MVREGAPRLLVADDDAELRDLLAFLFSDAGYHVTLAASLAEAMAVLKEQAFDVVLTGVFCQPPHPPLASVAPLQEQAAPTPVGVMTGQNLNAEAASQAGFAFLIPKPFDVHALLATVAGQVLQRDP